MLGTLLVWLHAGTVAAFALAPILIIAKAGDGLRSGAPHARRNFAVAVSLMVVVNALAGISAPYGSLPPAAASILAFLCAISFCATLLLLIIESVMAVEPDDELQDSREW